MRFRLKIEKFAYLKWGFALSQDFLKEGEQPKKFVYLKCDSALR